MDRLVALGVAVDGVYVDHGLIGTNRERPGSREAQAACREGDTLEFVEGDEPDLGTSADTAALERINARGTREWERSKSQE